MKKTACVMEKTIQMMFAVIVVYLLLLTTFTTATMNTVEHTVLLESNAAEKVLVIIICFGVTLGLSQFCRAKKTWGNLTIPTVDFVHRILLLALGIFAALFILSAQKEPNADQYLVADIARKWRKQDYGDFQQGEYLNLFPHQCGIVLIYFFLSFLVGQNNFLALQMINVISQIFLAKALGDLAVEINGWKSNRILVDLAFLFFLPLTLFGSFVYGNWPGLALSMAAMVQAVGLCRDGRKCRILWCALLMLGALFFKENCLIPGIALILYLGISFLRERKKVFLAAMVTLIAVLGLHGIVIRGTVWIVTGQKMGSGTSKWAFVQMGLMENEIMYDGWWNRYHQDTFVESEYDSGVQEVIVKRDLEMRVAELRADPEMALCFFAGKNASQWANPDFGSIYKNLVMQPLTDAISPGWVYWMLSLDERAPFRVFMGAVQTAVFFGALLSILLTTQRRDLVFFLETAFIGGFLFHTVWEAKGQYTLSYFILLMPLAAQGYNSLAHLWRQEKDRQGTVIRLVSMMGCLGVIMLMIRFGDIPFFQELFMPWL